MIPQEIIRRKRDGGALSPDEIFAFIAGVTRNEVSEGQIAAFAMAVFFRGLDRGECVALTDAMALSGSTMDWTGDGLHGPVLDKHSTGGVGDNVSLMLAPMIAACGGYVPMISGRGLGHTGGTLDKLESIAGYNATPDLGVFRAVVRGCGCAIIGQTAELAPADRRIYAIRDVAATVESIPLITASILSKKRAAGLGGLVMDVKTGSGAFMCDLANARALARSLVEVADGAGLPTRALLTDMNEPLASAAGNAVEVRNAVEFLAGSRRDRRLLEVTMALGVEALVLGGLASGVDEARRKLTRALDSGAAAERFARMVHALGGPGDILERPGQLPVAPVARALLACAKGAVATIDTRALGLAILVLGGGRVRADVKIDHAAGLSEIAGIGTFVEASSPLCIIHARDETSADLAERVVRAAYTLSESPVAIRPPVIERVAPL